MMLKKLLIVLCALTLAITPALADEPTLAQKTEAFHSGMAATYAGWTDEQVLLTILSGQMELFSRGKTAQMPLGTYVVGMDLPAGRYELAGPESGQYATVWHTRFISSYYYIGGEAYPGQTVTLDLEDGDTIRVERAPATIRQAPRGLVWE